MLKKNQKGFTLIELLIVVAIIAILAAIAIPQFAAYRMRGFNAAATSDVRNTATAQEALFADSQGYGDFANAMLTPVAVAAGGTVVGPGPISGATAGVAGAQVRNNRGAVPFSVSANVYIASKGTPDALNNVHGDYTIVSKNVQGDTCYGRDSDSSAMYRGTGVIGGTLAAGDPPNSTTGVDNLVGVAAGASCTGAFAAM